MGDTTRSNPPSWLALYIQIYERGGVIGRLLYGPGHFRVCLPVGRARHAAAPQPFAEQATSRERRLQALGNEDVVQPVAQAARIERAGPIAHVKTRQRVAIDQ